MFREPQTAKYHYVILTRNAYICVLCAKRTRKSTAFYLIMQINIQKNLFLLPLCLIFNEKCGTAHAALFQVSQFVNPYQDYEMRLSRYLAISMLSEETSTTKSERQQH